MFHHYPTSSSIKFDAWMIQSIQPDREHSLVVYLTNAVNLFNTMTSENLVETKATRWMGIGEGARGI